MKIIAWTNLALIALNLLTQPFMYGKSRGNYDASSWFSSIMSAAMFIPLCGRILGWW